MDIKKVVEYWTTSAEDDLPVATHLFASNDYHYALFFGHLYLEKLMKALVVQVKEEHAPRSHNLIYLAECANLTLSDSQRKILTRVNKYNLETRYPADREALRTLYTKDFTQIELKTIQETGEWLNLQLNRKKTS
jgi:HEPN domain-containing protein